MKEKPARPQKRKSSNYAFSILDEREMLLWDKKSTQQYLGAPTELLNSTGIVSGDGDGIITAPSNPNFQILRRYGITAMAFSRRSRDFYHYVKKRGYATITIVCSGKISFGSGGGKTTARAGEMLSIPHDKDGVFAVASKSAEIIWFDAAKNSEIYKKSRGKISVVKIKSLEAIKAVLNLYKNEAYENGDAQVLEAYAAAFYALLAREFFSARKNSGAELLKAQFAQMQNSARADMTASQTAKKLGISIYELNKLCVSVYGRSFSKAAHSIRLGNAAQMLKSGGYSCAEAAKKAGYGSVFAFSHAFKAAFGKRPSDFAKDA